MWEAIRANNRRSNMLIGLMGGLLVGFGALIGGATAGEAGLIPGAIGALLIWLVLLVVALTSGEQLVMMASRAKQIKKEDAPQLWNVVEEMTIAAGLGQMPRVYVIDNDLPNAFAAGRKPESACVAVTSGMLKRLNRDELQGVIAHEIAHIKNLDVRFMTIASVMVGSIVILCDVFLRMLWFGGGSRRQGKGGGSGQAQLIMLVVAIVAAIVAPICARMLYFACSRKREYLADASAARFTRYPDGLASALEKMSAHYEGSVAANSSSTLGPLYIVNPHEAALSGMASRPRRVPVLLRFSGRRGCR